MKKHVSRRDDSLGDIAGATGGERMINRKQERELMSLQRRDGAQRKKTGIGEADRMVVNWQLKRRKHAIPLEDLTSWSRKS